MADDQAGSRDESEPETPKPQEPRLQSPHPGSEPVRAPEAHAEPAPEQAQDQTAGAAAEQAASDSRVAAALGQQPADQPPPGAPINWWEQPPAAVAPAPVPEAEQQIAPVPTETTEGERTSFWRWLWEAAVLVVLAFVIAFAIKSYAVQPFYIPSASMEPTLRPGDRVLVNKFIYRVREPEADDIVVFEAPKDSEQRDFIKRVVAVEGQTVEMKDGKLYVEGRLKEESYLQSSRDHTDFGPVTLGENTVFVMGDNRTNSSDSRVFGPFDRARIVGEAFAVYWPVPRVRTL